MYLLASCLTLALLLSLSLPLAARGWTNQGGQKIEADYVSSDGTTVFLKLKGRDLS